MAVPRFATIALLLVNSVLGWTQNPKPSEKPYDTKRCTPRIIRQGDLPKNMGVFVQKGEKATGYTPLISFQILESGKVANARVKRSSGFAKVDKYALESIQGTRYNARPGCGVIERTADILIHWD